MGARRSVWTVSALMAFSAALAWLPGATQAAEEQPDLKIEVVGLEPGSRRDVLVRVTNVSDWWSDRTTATVVTTAPTPGNRRTEEVMDLNTKDEAPLPHQYEFVYTLSEDCKPGLKVKATLTAGANYEGVKESGELLDNNAHEREVCPAQAAPNPAPATKPGADGVDLGGVILDRDSPVRTGRKPVDLTPRHKRPGQHTAVFEVSSWSEGGASKTYAPVCGPRELVQHTPLPEQAGSPVGWHQFEPSGHACSADTYELAVYFDDGILSQVPVKTITRAVLTYDEAEFKCSARFGVPGEIEGPYTCWTNGRGLPEHKPNGCVIVSIPTVDWRNGHRGELPNTTTRPEVKRLAAREWDVTAPFRWQHDPNARPLTRPGEAPPSPGFGFLLRGALNIHQLAAQDNTRCVSDVSNVRLHVTYTVPAEDDRGPVVK